MQAQQVHACALRPCMRPACMQVQQVHACSAKDVHVCECMRGTCTCARHLEAGHLHFTHAAYSSHPYSRHLRQRVEGHVEAPLATAEPAWSGLGVGVGVGVGVVLGLGLGPSCCRRSARMRHEAQAGLPPWHGRRASCLGTAWADAGHARRPWSMQPLPTGSPPATGPWSMRALEHAGGLLRAPVACGRPWSMRALPVAEGLLRAPPLTEVICGDIGEI
jgi:hypothetical protein